MNERVSSINVIIRPRVRVLVYLSIAYNKIRRSYVEWNTREFYMIYSRLWKKDSENCPISQCRVNIVDLRNRDDFHFLQSWYKINCVESAVQSVSSHVLMISAYRSWAIFSRVNVARECYKKTMTGDKRKREDSGRHRAIEGNDWRSKEFIILSIYILFVICRINRLYLHGDYNNFTSSYVKYSNIILYIVHRIIYCNVKSCIRILYKIL